MLWSSRAILAAWVIMHISRSPSLKHSIVSIGSVAIRTICLSIDISCWCFVSSLTFSLFYYFVHQFSVPSYSFYKICFLPHRFFLTTLCKYQKCLSMHFLSASCDFFPRIFWQKSSLVPSNTDMSVILHVSGEWYWLSILFSWYLWWISHIQ